MVDAPLYPDSNGDPGDDAGLGHDRESTTSTPRWVKVFGIIAVVLVVLFAVLHLAGRGLGSHTLRPSVTEQGVQQT